MRDKPQMNTLTFLRLIGVGANPPSTAVLDPGYDAVTLQAHLEQSHHLISTLKLSMACWLIANEEVVRRKVAAADKYRVTTTTGGGPFEIAVAQGELSAYLDLCANIGVKRIECGEGFTELPMEPREVVKEARGRNLDVQFELGKKHDGAFNKHTVESLIETGQRWLDAGAIELIIEARESAKDIGLFDGHGCLNKAFADRFVEAFGMQHVTFEAPDKASQFALLNHYGSGVRLSNVRLEELLRVEIYRRGLHSDAFDQLNLRPCPLPRRVA